MSEEFDLFADDGNTEEYQKLMAEKKAEAAAADKAKKKKEVIMKSAVTFNIRPADSETKLDDLLPKILGITLEGLEWKAHEFVPLAFGVKQIRIMCHVVDDICSVDEVQEKIEAFEDDVGSVEIESFNKL